jgi:hypothetical protein
MPQRHLSIQHGAAANPLADARGSDRSPEREGGVAPIAQHHTVGDLVQQPALPEVGGGIDVVEVEHGLGLGDRVGRGLRRA